MEDLVLLTFKKTIDYNEIIFYLLVYKYSDLIEFVSPYSLEYSVNNSNKIDLKEKYKT